MRLDSVTIAAYWSAIGVVGWPKGKDACRQPAMAGLKPNRKMAVFSMMAKLKISFGYIYV